MQKAILIHLDDYSEERAQEVWEIGWVLTSTLRDRMWKLGSWSRWFWRYFKTSFLRTLNERGGFWNCYQANFHWIFGVDRESLDANGNWPCWGAHTGDRWSRNKEGCVRLRNRKRLMEHIPKVFVRLFQCDTNEVHGCFAESQSVNATSKVLGSSLMSMSLSNKAQSLKLKYYDINGAHFKEQRRNSFTSDLSVCRTTQRRTSKDECDTV